MEASDISTLREISLTGQCWVPGEQLEKLGDFLLQQVNLELLSLNALELRSAKTGELIQFFATHEVLKNCRELSLSGSCNFDDDDVCKALCKLVKSLAKLEELDLTDLESQRSLSFTVDYSNPKVPVLICRQTSEPQKTLFSSSIPMALREPLQIFQDEEEERK